MKRFMPKTGQKFRAFLKIEIPGKEHVGSPFVCIESDDKIVTATDKNGMVCSMYYHDFAFESLD